MAYPWGVSDHDEPLDKRVFWKFARGGSIVKPDFQLFYWFWRGGGPFFNTPPKMTIFWPLFLVHKKQHLQKHQKSTFFHSKRKNDQKHKNDQKQQKSLQNALRPKTSKKSLFDQKHQKPTKTINQPKRLLGQKHPSEVRRLAAFDPFFTPKLTYPKNTKNHSKRYHHQKHQKHQKSTLFLFNSIQHKKHCFSQKRHFLHHSNHTLKITKNHQKWPKNTSKNDQKYLKKWSKNDPF